MLVVSATPGPPPGQARIGSASRRAATRLLSFALPLLVAALLMAQLLVGLVDARQRIGATLRQERWGLLVTDVPSDLPAERAGMAVGDALLSIAGRPCPNLNEYARIVGRLPAGARVEFVVRRGGMPVKLTVTPGVPFAWGMFLLDGLAALCFLGVGLLAYRQRAGDTRATVLFLLCLGDALVLAMPQYVVGFVALYVVTKIAADVLGTLAIGLELHLASLIPERPEWLERRPWIVPGIYVLAGLCAAVTVLPDVTEGVFESNALPWTAEYAHDLVWDIALPVLMIAVLVLLALQALRFPEPHGRHQAGLVFLGALPAACASVVSGAMLLAGKSPPEFMDTLWPLWSLCFPVAVFIAIYRYRLFDLEVVVRGSLICGALTGAVVLAFYGALGIGGALASEAMGGGSASAWVVGCAIVVLGFLFGPLRTFIQRAIDRAVFPERQALGDSLNSLAYQLPRRASVPAMGRYLVERLSGVVAARDVTVLLTDVKDGFLLPLASTKYDSSEAAEMTPPLAADDDGVRMLRRGRRAVPAAQAGARSAALAVLNSVFAAAVVVPLVTHDRLVGLLLLGEKVGGRDFSLAEFELLSLFGHDVATVFENVRLFQFATYESLTGLLRREAVLDQLEKEVERARRYERPLAVGLADLDRFKGINSTYGHLVGDGLLRAVAHALSAGLRRSDALGRYGGDEFLLVLAETSLEGAIALAEKVRGLVEEVRVAADGNVVSTTVSIGLSTLADAEQAAHSPVEALLAAADRNLFHAKALGGNRVVPDHAASGA
jgi:diguanylate cyclase (GGDEF)-like protein